MKEEDENEKEAVLTLRSRQNWSGLSDSGKSVPSTACHHGFMESC